MLPVLALREIQKNFGRLALLTLLLTITASVLGGGLATPDAITTARDTLYDRLRFADLDLTFSVILDDDLPSVELLEKIEGVAAVSRRLVVPAYMTTEQGPFPLLVVWLDPRARPAVNDLDVLRGGYLEPGRPRAALVDRTLARYQHVQLGDEVHVQGFGSPLSFRVTGVALSPEFLLPTANPGLLFPPKGSLGVLYASTEELDELWRSPHARGQLRRLPNSAYLTRRLAMARLAEARARGEERPSLGGPFRRLIGLRPRPIRGRLCNNLLFRFTPGADAAATRRRILDRLPHLQIDRASPREANYAYRFLQEDLKGFYILTPFSACVLATLSAVVAFLTVGRLVAVRRHDLGTLMALGFAPGQLVWSMLQVTALPAVLAAALGWFGIDLFARFLMYGYSEAIGLPDAPLPSAPLLRTITILVPLVVAVAASLWPLRRILRLRPVEAIRGARELALASPPVFLDRALAGTQAGTRFAVRNLFRKAAVSLITMATVALAIGLPASFLTALGSWTRWVEDTLGRMRYDALVTLQTPLAAESAGELLPAGAWTEAEPFRTADVSLQWDDGSIEEMRLLGLPVPSRHQPLAIIRGAPFSGPDADEVILNRSFAARDLSRELGRLVIVRVAGKEHTLRVVGLANEATFQTVYVPLRTANRLLDQTDLVSGFTVRLPEGPVPEARAAYLRQPQIARFQTRADIGQAALDYVEDFRLILFPVVFCSGLFCLLFLATVLSILLRDREVEYALLRALGAGAGDIARIVLVEVLGLAVCAVGLAVPVWLGLAQALRRVMAEAWFDTGLTPSTIDFAAVACPVLVFLGLAAMPSIRSILNLPLGRTIQRHIRD